MKTTERPGSAIKIEQRIEEIDQLIQEIEDVLAAEPKPRDLRPENEDELRTTQNQLARDRVYLDESLNRRMEMTNITDFVGEYVPEVETVAETESDLENDQVNHEATIRQDMVSYGEEHVDLIGQTPQQRLEAAARLESARASVDAAFAA